MKILVLSKRQYMGKDLLDDRFGRFRELPLELARLGHDVRGLCLSYRPRSEGRVIDPLTTGADKVTWQSVNLLCGYFPALSRYFRRARQLIRNITPDIIWAGSDAFHAIFAARLAKEFKLRYVIDLYDNFESYGATAVPGILQLFKEAVRSAHGVTCVSQQLAEYVQAQYRCIAPLSVLENAVCTDLFRPLDRIASRSQLGLPVTATIIGTAGALHKSRGTKTLYRSYTLLAAKDSNLHLAVAGPRHRNDKPPRGDRIHDLGELPHGLVSTFMNALDVAVVCNRDTEFSRYNFPQKAREILACGTPIVAASVGAMKYILAAHPECLYTPDDPISLTQALRRQIRQPSEITEPIPSWADMAAQLEDFFQTVQHNHAINRQ